MRLTETPKMNAAINVTPLVDVVLVLLIIFMVVAPHMNKGPGPEIDLPATAKPLEQGTPVRILVTIDEHGALWIEDQPVAAERFAESLHAAAGTHVNPKVVIQGDAKLPFREVRQAMLAVEQAGFQGVALAAERVGTDRRGG
jgi:biopolymer transport protein ExbD